MPAQRMRSVIPPYMLRRIIEHGNARSATARCTR